MTKVSDIESEGKNNFKIIAIKILAGCKEDYYKLLTPEKPYYFYNNYEINELTDEITHEDVVNEDFFNVKDININISAIVGKNGSGKSTIIELLFRSIYSMSRKQKYSDNRFEPLFGFKVAVYYHTDRYYKIEIDGPDVLFYEYDKETSLPKKAVLNQNIPDFFYSIAVNYSHYAYNHRDLDELNWLDLLFHKNDGYQIPLVINPMRIDGNIDINTENHLVISRLIANFLLPNNENNFSFRDISNNLQAYKLHLRLNESKTNKILWGGTSSGSKQKDTITLADFNHQRTVILDKLNVHYPFKLEYLEKEYDIVLDYIMFKLANICLRYADYKKYFSIEKKMFKDNLLSVFIQKLIGDTSHITFKLRQALNFLLFQNLPLYDQYITLDHLQDELIRMRSKYPERNLQLIEIVPPPIFSIEIILRSKSGKGEDVSFKKLSSGEKQLTFSVSSLLYHLVNINSVIETEHRIKYKYVNIVLEEIELYFHPEMQRRYVNHILNSIDKINLPSIKSINFCFVTHSPFILSDIPNSNIMFLNENGTLVDKGQTFKTFGANIHDLLKQSFFLDQGTMGEFAKSKIQGTIDYLNFKRNERELEEAIENELSDEFINAKKIELIGYKKLVKSFDPELHIQLIKIIDEPILKQKLLQMFDDFHFSEHRLRQIEDKIALLTREAQTIRRKK